MRTWQITCRQVESLGKNLKDFVLGDCLNLQNAKNKKWSYHLTVFSSTKHVEFLLLACSDSLYMLQNTCIRITCLIHSTQHGFTIGGWVRHSYLSLRKRCVWEQERKELMRYTYSHLSSFEAIWSLMFLLRMVQAKEIAWASGCN